MAAVSADARKAAVVMLSLDPEHRQEILRRLPKRSLRLLRSEMKRLKEIPSRVRGEILAEFCRLAEASAVLEAAVNRAPAPQLPSAREKSVPFDFLQQAHCEQFLSFVADEQPQTIALILAHLPSTKAGELLAGLPPGRQIDVIRCIAAMQHADPQIVEQVEQSLRQRLNSLLHAPMETDDGVDVVAEILHSTDPQLEQDIMHNLEAEDPQLVEQIRRSLFDDDLPVPVSISDIETAQQRIIGPMRNGNDGVGI